LITLSTVRPPSVVQISAHVVLCDGEHDDT
jgi:hypothetical protein